MCFLLSLFFLYKLLCDIELTRTRFVRVTSKSNGGGSGGSDGGSRPRREIDIIIIILFFVWSVSQTSLCVYATTRVRTCTTVYHVVLSVVVFKSSSTIPSLLCDYPSNSNNNNNNYYRIRGQCVCARTYICAVGSIVARIWYLFFLLFLL